MGTFPYNSLSEHLAWLADVIVQADAVTTGIDGIVGLRPRIFLPFVAR